VSCVKGQRSRSLEHAASEFSKTTATIGSAAGEGGCWLRALTSVSPSAGPAIESCKTRARSCPRSAEKDLRIAPVRAARQRVVPKWSCESL